MQQILRPHAEDLYQHELEYLMANEKNLIPQNWRMSPQSVVTYLMGGDMPDGMKIEPKYFGNRRLMEVAVASLATDRALLLIGVPGTAKTWVSEHLAAAISGASTCLVQGTAGMSEDAMRYGWNYAQLLAKGPSMDALIPSPIMDAMRNGKIARIEELTRIPSDVQDTLITILSEKTLPIPELNTEVQAQMGFNVIATANDRDKGVNELSSALKRRFNTVVLPLPSSLEEEVEIVQTRVAKFAKQVNIPNTTAPLKEIVRLVTLFRELRLGKTEDNKSKLKSPTGTLSTAEAISVMNNAQTLATHFGNGQVDAKDLAASLIGAVIKDASKDTEVVQEYLETIVKGRKDWKDLYEACKELV